MSRVRRPLDFFGHHDYAGGDPNDYIASIAKSQEAWDKRRAAMPWWLRLLTSKA